MNDQPNNNFIDPVQETNLNADADSSNSAFSANAQKNKKLSFLQEVVENFEVAIFAVIAVVLLFSIGVRLCYVSGPSMNQTLDNNDWVIVSNIGYEPQRGDIIVFHMTSAKYQRLNEPMVKRVIATEGEWIDIDFDTWTVRIADNPEMNNAITLDEPYRYLSDGPLIKSSFTYPLEIPKGYIFVMGDNRNNSLDSRNSEQIGLIDTRRVIGKVICRVYPLKAIEN